MRPLISVFLVAALTGCAAKITLIDRTNGQLYYGATDGSTMGGSGNASLLIEGETFTGPWIYQPSGGSFGFSNFGATTVASGNVTAFSPTTGFASATVSGAATTTGNAMAMTVSAVWNGIINAREPGGKFVRCVFSFNTLQNTGIGECLRSD
jgi:hypothetical protein